MKLTGSPKTKSSQEEGWIGRAVGGMIRRSVRSRFHTVYWNPPQVHPLAPTIFVPNHHGWFDGYLMYLAATKMQVPIIDWIAEFDAFPLFAKIGGMPFPPGDSVRRTATVLKTLRLMKQERRSLLLFAEGILHYPGEVFSLERSLEFVAKKVPEAQIVPVGIVYEHAMHERPEAFLQFGAPIVSRENLGEVTRLAISELVEQTRNAVRSKPLCFEILAQGTKDVNERMDMRRFKR